jgi:glucuronoarabinoxylan endo-1,4-beta-xylanase
MIYSFSLVFMIGLISLSDLYAQAPTSFETDFSNAADYGNWVSLDLIDTIDEFLFDVSNQELHMTIDKTSWHYVQLWVKPFNFKQSPYISFDIKTNEAIEITIGVKGGDTWQLEQTFTTSGAGEYEHIFLDYSSQASVMTVDMEEMQFMVPFGNFTGELWLDNYKMGDAAIPPLVPEGTGFTLDFEGAWPDTSWKSDQQYTLNQSGGSLEVGISKFEPGITFQYDHEGVYAISGNPYVNVRAKADKPLVLWVRIWEGTRSAERKVRVYATTGFTDYCLDFSDSGNVYLGEVRMIEFGVNESATSFDGTLWLDELRVGTDASRFANLAGIRDQSFYRGSKGNAILISDLENHEMVTVSGGESLIENISFTGAGTHAVSMNFDCIDDITGTTIVTFTAVGKSGWEDNSVDFNLSVIGNMPPVVDQAEDLEARAGDEYTLKISGIGDGDATVEQDLLITASSSDTSVIDTAYCEYTSGPYANLSFTPVDSGLTTLTLTLDDGEAADNITTMDFQVTSFLDLNAPPTIDDAGDLVITPDAGEQIVLLTGISDGDGTGQALTLTAQSSADTVIPSPTVEYTGGSTAQLKFTPDPANPGSSTITVRVADDGGTELNNGDQETVISFMVESLYPNKKGYVVPLDESHRNMWSLEKEGVVYHMSYVDSGDFQAMEIVMTGKSTWDGIWMSLPEELDLSGHPYISYEVYSVDQPTYHWNYFYDNNMDRNIKNSTQHMYEVPANTWTLLSFDYSDPGDMQTNEAREINAERIQAVLFNLHDAPGSWPFYTIDGTVYYRNIRIGDSAVIAAKTPVATIDGVPDQVNFAGSGEHTLILTGISDGMGGGATVMASSRNTGLVPDPLVNAGDTGTATLSYTVGDQTGSSKITLTVSAEGSTDKLVTFDISINQEDISASATVTIDPSQTFQEIEGLGVHWLNSEHVDRFVNDLGGSVLRYWQIDNILEPVNDNDDPYVLNRDALDYSALDTDLINRLTDAGMNRFIFTIFTPPAWMKRNLSTNATEQAPYYENTDNILEPYYFEEFAEHMVAWVTLFKEECGVDLYAVGLQNEPAFSEPYASAVYSPAKFAELIAVVGKRFEEEGITTRIFATEALFYPNQYSFGQYVEAINNNPDADQYTHAIATHHFSTNGKAGSPTRETEWSNLWDYIDQGSREKVYWQTEESAFGASGSNPLADAMYLAGMYRDAFQLGNMALNSWLTFYRPGPANDAGLLEGREKTYLYYIHKHFYRYVRPDAVRLGSSSDNQDLLPLAFLHEADGTYTIILMNTSNRSISFDLAGSNIPEEFTVYTTAREMKFKMMQPLQDDLYLLPPNSITTLVSDRNSPLTIDQVANQVIPANAPPQTVNLSGISDGQGSTAGITMAAISSDTSLVTDLQVADLAGDGTSSLVYTPAAGRIGSAKISVTIDDGESSRTMSFYVTVEVPEGVGEMDDGKLLLYPNPAHDLLHVIIPETGFDELTITDMSGRVLMMRQIGRGSLLEHISLAGFEQGMYVATLRSQKTSIRSRFIVR